MEVKLKAPILRGVENETHGILLKTMNTADVRVAAIRGRSTAFPDVSGVTYSPARKLTHHFPLTESLQPSAFLFWLRFAKKPPWVLGPITHLHRRRSEALFSTDPALENRHEKSPTGAKKKSTSGLFTACFFVLATTFPPRRNSPWWTHEATAVHRGLLFIRNPVATGSFAARLIRTSKLANRHFFRSSFSHFYFPHGGAIPRREVFPPRDKTDARVYGKSAAARGELY